MPVKLDPTAPQTDLATKLPASAPRPNPVHARTLPGRGEPGAWLDVFDALPDDAECPSLEGSCWAGEDTSELWRFDPGGVFTYGGGQALYANGTWLQRGRHFYAETNGRYAERRGTIDGDALRGEFHNVAGLTQPLERVRIAREAFDARARPRR